MKRCVPLEPAAEAVSLATSQPPYIFQLPPKLGRLVLDTAQDSPVEVLPVRIDSRPYTTLQWGTVEVFRIVPENLSGTPNVIYYLHGGGWVLGNIHTHRKLVAELAVRTNSIVFFPEYTLSPEAKYPTALEQCYEILVKLPEIAEAFGSEADFQTLTVAGDSAGGNLATSLTLLAKFRSGPRIARQLLYYPVTNACFNTPSYCEFATGYYLYREGMIWFWEQYLAAPADANRATASPLRASFGQLTGLPPAMILTGQADVLRDEGECYAERLREAGVEVTQIRFQAIIHDFVMLNSLDQTNACRAAMDVSVSWINRNNAKLRGEPFSEWALTGGAPDGNVSSAPIFPAEPSLPNVTVPPIPPAPVIPPVPAVPPILPVPPIEIR